MLDTIDLAKALIERASITPEDAGCQEFIAETLKHFGFKTTHLPFDNVKNIWLQRGTRAPHFLFVGHTDVVPAGEHAHWLHPPFHPTIYQDMLYGRGAADMKGSIAAFITACARFVTQYPDHAGSLSILLTSDEEGPGIHGVRQVAELWRQQDIHIDYCLVGEPTSEHHLGDIIKIGRRGSLTGRLRINGVQGHIAYPHLAKNPIHHALPVLTELVNTTWDEGTEHFAPTQFQIASIHAGAGASNVIPNSLEVVFNFRYNPKQTVEQLQEKIAHILNKDRCSYELEWSWSGYPYYAPPGSLAHNAQSIIKQQLEIMPKFSTDGGTSDGRFLAPLSTEIIELGLINRTIHQINECVALKDLEALSVIYEKLLQVQLNCAKITN